MRHPVEQDHELSPFTGELDREAPWAELESEAVSPFVDEADFAREAEDSESAFDGEDVAETGCRCGRAHRELEGPEQEEEDEFPRLLEEPMVRGMISGGQRDENALTNFLFYQRHPDLAGRKLTKGDVALAAEWREIRDQIVRPQLGTASGAVSGSPSSGPSGGGWSGGGSSDPDVRDALRIANAKVPGMSGTTIAQLVEQYRVQVCPEVPLALLIAFIRYESGGKFSDATHGTSRNNPPYSSPEFYELGLFQTPAGLHGRCTSGDPASCEYGPPGLEGRRPSTWARGCAALGLDARDWKNPVTQVRVGLWSLAGEANLVRGRFKSLFPRRGSDWDLRMAFCMPHSRGIGHTQWFLQDYMGNLAVLPEDGRWGFLRDKTVVRDRRRAFHPENVDKKMALAARLASLDLLAGRGTSSPQSGAPAASGAVVPVADSKAFAGEVPVLGSPPRSILPGARPVPAGAALSPLSWVSPLGLKRYGRARDPKSIYGLIVHTTGSGPATVAKTKRAEWGGCTDPVQCALNMYHSMGVGPHYVIGYDGVIYAVCPEDSIAYHAGWGENGFAHYRGLTGPEWWRRVWNRTSPVELLPPGAKDPNGRSIGVELLGQSNDSGFTEAQYRALAQLVHDVETRYQLSIPAPPNVRLLGHEDVSPDKRELSRGRGGWDPGAHRVNPRFSWSKLGGLLVMLRAGASFELEGGADPWGAFGPGESEVDADPWAAYGPGEPTNEWSNAETYEAP